MVMGVDDSELHVETKGESKGSNSETEAETTTVDTSIKKEPIESQEQQEHPEMLEIPPEFEVPSMMDGMEIEGIGLSDSLNDQMDLS